MGINQRKTLDYFYQCISMRYMIRLAKKRNIHVCVCILCRDLRNQHENFVLTLSNSGILSLRNAFHYVRRSIVIWTSMFFLCTFDALDIVKCTKNKYKSQVGRHRLFFLIDTSVQVIDIRCRIIMRYRKNKNFCACVIMMPKSIIVDPSRYSQI